jgi:hypothetical protein
LASEGGEDSETGSGGFPDLPEQEDPSCLEQGGSYALVGEPTIILEAYPEFVEPTDIEATSEGVLAFWRVGFNGSDPMPNTFARPYSAQLEAIGDPVTLMERPVTHGPRAHPLGEGFELTMCGRWGYEDRGTSMRVDAMGVPLAAEVRRSPEDRHCGIAGHVPDGAWTGARQLFAWRDNSSGPVPGYELLLDVYGEDGVSLGWTQLQDDGDWYPEPRFVVGPQAAFLVSWAANDQVMLHRFDPSGAWDEAGAVDLAVPGPVDSGDIALAADAEGFVLWMGERSEPYRIVRWQLGPTGALLDGPVYVEPEGGYGIYSDFEMERRPGGFAVAASVGELDWSSAGVGVLYLDGAGEYLEEVVVPTPPGSYLGRPQLAQRGDSSYLLYSIVHEDDTSDLAIAEIACSL